MTRLTLSAAIIAVALCTASIAQAQTLYNSTTPTATTTVQATPQTVAVPAPATSTATPAPVAQTPVATGTPSAPALQYGKQVGATCPDKWESPECMSAISTSNLVMLGNYGEALQQKGLNDDAEQIKQHCAASTAAREQSFPAYAMKSAFIECANLIADITAKTGIQPDLSQYQLMVGATMCLDKDPRCAAIQTQLKALASR